MNFDLEDAGDPLLRELRELQVRENNSLQHKNTSSF